MYYIPYRHSIKGLQSLADRDIFNGGGVNFGFGEGWKETWWGPRGHNPRSCYVTKYITYFCVFDTGTIIEGLEGSVTSVRFNCSTWRMGEALMGARCRWEWGWGGGEALRATTFLPNKYTIPLYFGHRNKSLPRNIKIKLNMQRWAGPVCSFIGAHVKYM